MIEVWSFCSCAPGDGRSAYFARSALLTRFAMIDFMESTSRVGRFSGLARICASAFSGTKAGNVELQDDGVVDQPVDRGGGRHRILEDALPVAEHQVAGDQHRASFIALGNQGEEDLRLFGALFDVANIIEDQELERIEPA